MALQITDSYPALRYDNLEAIEAELGVSLPEAYRAFLLEHNGGFLDAGRRAFDAPIPQVRGALHRATTEDSVTEFYGSGAAPRAGRAPASLVQANAGYRAEEFLPGDVVVVARCETDSLVCLSTGTAAPGRVWYWYYYWRYPWAAAHFEAAVAAVGQRYPDAARVLDDPGSADYQIVADAFNYATLVPIATSFDAFLAALRPEEPEAE